jgi:erythromycin esterase-like protein
MAETLSALMNHLHSQQHEAKIVVWEHNSHLGDARATELGEQGELNVGQLVREKYGDEAVLVGFSTYAGTVTAATNWGGVAERKRVRPALAGSYEALFHKLRPKSFLLNLHGDEVAENLRTPRLERAIGVIYRPESERISHYFHARLADQFDAMIHFEDTRAVEPLERTSDWVQGELPETFPTGI